MSAQRELKMEPEVASRASQAINQSGLLPLGHAVLVQTYEPEIKRGLIELPAKVAERQSQLEQRCVVIAVGPECWAGEAVPRAKPGDRVLVTAYAGYLTSQTKDGQLYRLVNDRDIFAKIDWSES